MNNCNETSNTKVINVVMEVTPEISKMVQEIAFKHGFTWWNSTELLDQTHKYLYLKTSDMSYGLTAPTEDDFIQINPIHYINSQGTQYELPKVGKEYEFSNDKEKWRTREYLLYNPAALNPFKTTTNTYKYCRPVQKQLVFKDFLEENGVKWEDFLENCKTENQRWVQLRNYYTNFSDLTDELPKHWLKSAFSFKYSTILDEKDLFKLNKLWEELLLAHNTTPKWC